MTMTSVTVRVDDATKKQATDIVEDLGLDLSSVTRAFYRQIVRENRIPLSLSRQSIPAETLDAPTRYARRQGRFPRASRPPMKCSNRWESDCAADRIHQSIPTGHQTTET